MDHGASRQAGKVYNAVAASRLAPVRVKDALTEEMIQAYERDGVILLRNVIFSEDIEEMRIAVETAMANPGPYHTDFPPDGDKGRLFDDLYMYRRFDKFREFTFHSPAAEIAARASRSSLSATPLRHITCA